MVSIDAGAAFGPAVLRAEDAAAARVKAEGVARGLMAGGLDAVALAASDWKLGARVVFDLASAHQLPVLAANLRCDGRVPFPASVVVERGGWRLGIAAVTDGSPEGCEVSDPAASLRDAFAGMAEVDVRIALLPVNANATAQILSGLAVAPDLVFDAHPARLTEAPDQVGGALVFGTGGRGQHAGLTRLSWVDGAQGFEAVGTAAALQRRVDRLEARLKGHKERLEGITDPKRRGSLPALIARTEAELVQARSDLEAAGESGATRHQVHTTLVALDAAVGEHAATQAIVADVKTRLDALTPTAAGAATASRIAPSGSAYAGAMTCTGCHTEISAQWEGTPHAHAWDTLVKDGRAADPACFSCHSTGAMQPGGPGAPHEVRGLRDVQCEACHGPGRAHVANPSGVRLAREPSMSVCTGCHDGERDGGQFDPATYLPAVRHGSP